MSKQKVEIGRVIIPEGKTEWIPAGYETWLRSVSKEGIIYGIPPGGQKYTDAERKAVDASNKKVRDTFISKAKKLRDAQADALRALKKNPEDTNGKLRAAYKQAKEEREAFDAGRKAAYAKAKQEARKQVLK